MCPPRVVSRNCCRAGANWQRSDQPVGKTSLIVENNGGGVEQVVRITGKVVDPQRVVGPVRQHSHVGDRGRTLGGVEVRRQRSFGAGRVCGEERAHRQGGGLAGGRGGGGGGGGGPAGGGGKGGRGGPGG